MIDPSQRSLPDSTQHPQFQQASSRTHTPLDTTKLEAEQTQHNIPDKTPDKEVKINHFIAHGSSYTEPDPTGMLVSQGTSDCLAQRTRFFSSRHAGQTPAVISI
jgi:hypothetical protein